MPREAETLILQDNPTFRANVEALSVRQPDLARRLEEVEPPPAARIVCGRDGEPVVQLAAGETRVCWLGGSSMPSVSAPAVLAGFADQGSNVAVVSIGTGHEARLLARRIPAHCAVFVCEADIVNIALALAVVDLSDAIRPGRIILIDGEVEESLAAFLVEHPGFVFPTQLYPLPGLSEAELGEPRAAIERAGRRVHADRQQRTAEVAAEVARLLPASGAERPCVVVLSVDAIGGAVQHAAHIGRTLATLGWKAASCVPEAPEKCHALARLAAVRDSSPDLVLFLNCTPGPLRSTWPSAVPYACWFLESAALPAIALEGLSPCRRLLAASDEVRVQLLAWGANTESVTVLETGVDDTVFRPLDPADVDQTEGYELAVLCDGQDTSVEASNIGLESHARLWKQMTRLLTTAGERDDGFNVETLFREAERQTSTRLKDQELRRQFIALVAGRLTKTISARTAVERLLSAARGPAVALWGTNWRTHAEVRSIHRGPIPAAEGRNVIYNTAQVVVLPFADADAFRHVAEALAAGCCPLIRRPDRTALKNYPQTGEILAAVPSFAGVTQLADQVEQLTDDPGKRNAMVTSLRERLLAGHTLRDRLIAVRDLLQPAGPA